MHSGIAQSWRGVLSSDNLGSGPMCNSQGLDYWGGRRCHSSGDPGGMVGWGKDCAVEAKTEFSFLFLLLSFMSSFPTPPGSSLSSKTEDTARMRQGLSRTGA